MAKATVALVRCEDYEYSLVRAAVKRCLDQVEGLDSLLAGARTVLLKPNLLSHTRGPEWPVNTHPHVVRAVGEYILEHGCRIQIGDSCGHVGATEEAFTVSRLREVAADLGAELVSFDRAPCTPLPQVLGRFAPPVSITDAVRSADLVFNLPKLKTHSLTFFTGAIKNMFGTIPGKGKKLLHRFAPKPLALARAAVDVFEAVRPQVVLIDGIVAMEGPGPNRGTARKVGVLIASRDNVAADAIACAIVGFRRQDVPMLGIAAKCGLGVDRFNEIAVVGENLKELQVADFRKPFGPAQVAAFALAPEALLQLAMWLPTSARAHVDDSRCVRCGRCLASCPPRALYLHRGRIACRAGRCIQCYCCEEICDHDAVQVREAWYVRAPRRLWRAWRALQPRQQGS